MHILLVNDDGVQAAGIHALHRELGSVASRITVVAPSQGLNALSRSLNLRRPITAARLEPGWYSVDGTPVDCVYLALHHILAGSTPDLVISGINHGPNLAQDVTYSGTVGAAMEAADAGFPTIAVSQTYRQGMTVDDFGLTARFVAEVVVPLIREADLPRGVFLNVNVPVPERPTDGLPPWRLTRLGRHWYAPEVEVREESGRTTYVLGGTLHRYDPIPGSDCVAFHQGEASVTPLSLDLTHDQALASLSARLEAVR